MAAQGRPGKESNRRSCRRRRTPPCRAVAAMTTATPCPGHGFFFLVIATPPSSSRRRLRTAAPPSPQSAPSASHFTTPLIACLRLPPPPPTPMLIPKPTFSPVAFQTYPDATIPPFSLSADLRNRPSSSLNSIVATSLIPCRNADCETCLTASTGRLARVPPRALPVFDLHHCLGVLEHPAHC